jgi:hypothetical protein
LCYRRRIVTLLRVPDQHRRSSECTVFQGSSLKVVLSDNYGQSDKSHGQSDDCRGATIVADNQVQRAASGREAFRINRPGESGPRWVFRRREGRRKPGVAVVAVETFFSVFLRDKNAAKVCSTTSRPRARPGTSRRSRTVRLPASHLRQEASRIRARSTGKKPEPRTRSAAGDEVRQGQVGPCQEAH